MAQLVGGPEPEGGQIEQTLEPWMTRDDLAFLGEDQGQVQEQRRGRKPAEEKQGREDIRGRKVEEGHEQPEPGETESQKHATLPRPGAPEEDRSPHAQLPQG